MPDAKSVLSASLRRVAREGSLRRFVEAPTMSHEIVSRYVAGTGVSSAVAAADDLIRKHRLVSLTLLSGPAEDEAGARSQVKRYRKLLRRLGEADLASGRRSEVSLPLEAIGLDLGSDGPALALEQAQRIARAAANVGAGLMIETDSAANVDATLEIVSDLRQDFPDVGVALQASLRRTEWDVRDLLGSRIRLQKGQTGGSDQGERFRRPADTDRAFARCMRILLTNPGTPVISTQDARLIEIAEALAGYHGRPSDSYEIQLRYGVRTATQAVIGDRGDLVRVYVPFGEDWYTYLINRVTEDPTNVGDLLKAAFAR